MSKDEKWQIKKMDCLILKMEKWCLLVKYFVASFELFFRPFLKIVFSTIFENCFSTIIENRAPESAHFDR